MKKEKLFNRNFTLLVLGQVSSLLGNLTLKFALSMYVLEQTGSASIFAGLLALSMVPTILLSPLGGILADRASRRAVMVTLDLLSGLAVLACAATMAYCQKMGGTGSIAVTGVLLVVLSILGAFESPTVQACVPQMLPESQLLKGNALVSQVGALSSLATPFLGSLFYTAFGILPVLWAAAACFLLTASLECLIHLPALRPSQEKGILSIIQKDFTESMRFLWKEQPDILRLLLLAALVSLFVAGTAVVGFPYLVRSVLRLSAKYYGAAESAMGAAAVLGCVFVGVWGHKLKLRFLTIILVVFGLCLLPAGAAFLLPFGTLVRFFLLLAMFCIGQFGCSIFSTCAISFIQARTPEHLMGKVMSYVFTFSMCAQPLGHLIYGALFDRLSQCVYWVLIPSGLLICLAGLAARRFFVRLERV